MAALETVSLLLPSQIQGLSSFLNTGTIVALCVFFALLCACIIIGHLLHGNRWANESITALLLGLCSGVVVLLVKKKQFFKNFTTILLFGVLGTVISFCVISLGVFLLFKKIGVKSLNMKQYLAVRAILSATDSVCTLQVLSQDETPFLYSVVFGEGVVNDATSIVLFNAVQSLNVSNISGLTALKLLGNFLYLFFTSTALGIVAGLLSAYIIKRLYFGRHSTDREVALMMLMAYLSYLLAELMDLSGILTVFFCGIVMSHYTWHNVTESSRITTKHTFATISFIAETFIFLYVGVDALDIDKWKTSKASPATSVTLSATMFGLVLVGRAAFVFPIANISNLIKKREGTKIEFQKQFIIWWSGLMRGAVTVALSYSEFSNSSEASSEDDALMITCTIIVVLLSTTVFGSVTKPLIEAVLLNHYKPTISDATDLTSLEDLRLSFVDNGAGSSEQGSNQTKGSSLRLLMTQPHVTVHYLWRKFDDKFMRPVFGGRGFVPFVPGSPTGAADGSERTTSEIP